LAYRPGEFELKKICFITTSSVTLKTFVMATAEYLYRNGKYDITFVCNEDEKFRKFLPGYIHYKPIKMRRGMSLSGIRAIFSMVHFFKKEGFDFVQYATPNASLYASIASKIAKIPIRQYGQWGIRYVGFRGIKRAVVKGLEKVVCRKSTHIYAASEKNKQFSVREGLYTSEHAKVLGTGGTIGVSLDEFQIEKKEEWGKEIREKYNFKDRFVFGFVGRISRDKGSFELLSAFRKMVEKNGALRLFMVGSEETGAAFDRGILNWAKKSDRVIFAGPVDTADRAKYYAAIDVYLHPSHREGFGMAIQEAGAMGCAVVTTDIPGASEVLENGRSCLLVQPGEVSELEEKMHTLLNDESLCKKMGELARLRVEEHFERGRMLKLQFDEYERIFCEAKR